MDITTTEQLSNVGRKVPRCKYNTSSGTTQCSPFTCFVMNIALQTEKCSARLSGKINSLLLNNLSLPEGI